MADLRIVDAPVLLQESITDDVKMPTGGLGNFSVRLGDILWYVITKEQLANKNYVDLSSKSVKDSLDEHIADKENPHQVTKVQVGLGNVDNTADIDKPVSNAVSSAIITATNDMATKAYVNSKDGDLTTLTTTDKTSLAKAINEVVSVKADKATKLVGYGISDAYTKSEIDTNYGGVKTLYDKNVQAGAGANGWTAMLVTDGNRTQTSINADLRTSYDLMTQAQIDAVRANTLTDDMSSILQTLMSSANDDVVVKAGTYYIGANGIQLTNVSNKRIIFERGAILKWQSGVDFSALRVVLTLANCSNIEIVNPVLRGANDPSVWVKTEKTIMAGLTKNQHGIMMKNCADIKITSPNVQNFWLGIYTLATSTFGKSTRIKIVDGYSTGNYAGIVWESYIVDGITLCDVLNTNSIGNWKWGQWMESGSTKNSRYIRGIKTIGGSFSEQIEEHGCYVQGQEHLFLGVSFDNNNTAGLRMLACGQLRVIGCRFTGNGFNANGIGYLAGACFIGDDTSTNDIIKRSNNVVFSDNLSVGNRFTFVDYKLDNNVVVSNNTSANNGTADGLTDGDIVFRSNQNSKISNNIIRDSLCAVGILVRDQGNSMSKNIDVNNNMVIGQQGIGIKYQWGASETDSELIRIFGNTVKGATGHGILVELNTRETRGVDISGNHVSYCGGAGIKTYLAATATCNFIRVAENTVTHCTSYGINYDGVVGGICFGLLDKNNHVQRNNSNGVQTYQTASGGAGYSTNQLVQSGMRRTVTFSLKDVTVAASGEVQLKLDGIIPFGRLPISARVKAIEFYCSKGIAGGSLSATVRAWTAPGTTGANMMSSSMTATIPVNQQDKSITNAMNSSADRILMSSKFYIGVDFNNTVVNGGGTVDLLCSLVLDYSDDWRFEVAL